MEPSAIEKGPKVTVIKDENDVYKSSVEKSQEAVDLLVVVKDEIELKSEMFTSEIKDCNVEVSEDVKPKCECSTCICRAKDTDLFTIGSIFTNSKVKLEDENSYNPCAISGPHLSPPGCFDYIDEEKINIGKIKLLSGDHEGDQGYLTPELDNQKQFEKIAQDVLIDLETGQKVSLRECTISLVDLKYSIRPLNTDRKFERVETDEVAVKPKSNYCLSKTQCQKFTDKPCYCRLCVCEVIGIDPFISTDYTFKNSQTGEDSMELLNNTRRFNNCIPGRNENSGITKSKKFKCSKCNNRFVTTSLLIGHMRRKHGNDKNSLSSKVNCHQKSSTTISNKIKCLKCNIKFVQSRDLLAHILNYHEDDEKLLESISIKIHECSSCHQKFSRKEQFVNHIFRKHKDDEELIKYISNKIVECSKCNEKFVRNRDLDMHILNYHKHDNTLLKSISRRIKECSNCHQKFYNIQRFQVHIFNKHKDDQELLKTISNKIIECSKCNEKFVRRLDLDVHILNHHRHENTLLKSISRKIEECSKCHQMFSNKQRFQVHIFNKHKDDQELLKTISNKIMECSKCNEKFVRKFDLDVHILNYHKHENTLLKSISSKIKECPNCHQKFFGQYGFEFHIFNKHKDDKELLKAISNKIIECSKCSKNFVRRYDLNAHIRKQHKQIRLETTEKCLKEYSQVFRSFLGDIS